MRCPGDEFIRGEESISPTTRDTALDDDDDDDSCLARIRMHFCDGAMR